MTDIGEIGKKIQAIEIALAYFTDYENDDLERKKALKLRFTEFPALKPYVGYSRQGLEDLLQELQKEKNLLLAKENQGE